jgi:hypothetical protein
VHTVSRSKIVLLHLKRDDIRIILSIKVRFRDDSTKTKICRFLWNITERVGIFFDMYTQESTISSEVFLIRDTSVDPFVEESVAVPSNAAGGIGRSTSVGSVEDTVPSAAIKSECP